jgi:hypothetical protein
MSMPPHHLISAAIFSCTSHNTLQQLQLNLENRDEHGQYFLGPNLFYFHSAITAITISMISFIITTAIRHRQHQVTTRRDYECL